MSVRLTKEQAKKCYQALDDAFEGHVEEFSAVANALIEMGVLVEPTPPAPGPTIEERLAALEAKANLPASEPVVPTDPDYPADVLKACPKAKEWRVKLLSMNEIWPFVWLVDGMFWSQMSRKWINYAGGGTHKTREDALANPPTLPPPGHVEPKPDPKPTPSLIEACAEAALEAVFLGMPWGDRVEPTKKEYRAAATAAITRFLEEPPSYEEAERACDAYLLVNGQQSGVRVNLGRMDAALEASRRVLLERVKGGV